MRNSEPFVVPYALSLDQDFSPGTALFVNDLVPEARLSPCSTDQFAASHTWVFTQSLQSLDRKWFERLSAGGTTESLLNQPNRLSLILVSHKTRKLRDGSIPTYGIYFEQRGANLYWRFLTWNGCRRFNTFILLPRP